MLDLVIISYKLQPISTLINNFLLEKNFPTIDWEKNWKSVKKKQVYIFDHSLHGIMLNYLFKYFIERIFKSQYYEILPRNL